jgi:hypothetical protein
VSISFYKIFGYPTGIGCLIAHHSALRKLQRPWYAGGTITFSSVLAFDHYLTPGPASFEDGTVNYLGIPAIELGLRLIESIGIDVIHTRVTCLTGWLIEQLAGLRHCCGAPLARIYGPPNTHMRGGTIQVNFFDPDGRLIDCTSVERMANEVRISLRAGCHCNPGAREVALGFTADDLRVCFKDKDSQTYEQFLHVIDGKTTGALRASLGLVTTFADVYTYVQFAKTMIDLRVLSCYARFSDLLPLRHDEHVVGIRVKGNGSKGDGQTPTCYCHRLLDRWKRGRYALEFIKCCSHLDVAIRQVIWDWKLGSISCCCRCTNVPHPLHRKNRKQTLSLSACSISNNSPGCQMVHNASYRIRCSGIRHKDVQMAAPQSNSIQPMGTT